MGRLLPTWSSGGSVALGAGQLDGLVSVRDGEIAGYRSSLDELAKGIADAVNGAHVAGFDQTGAPGLPFFSYTAGNAAATLTVNAMIVADPRLVAAAGAPGQPGNAAAARAIASLRTAKLFATGTQTVAERYAGLITAIGTDSRRASETSESQSLIVDHLRQRREATSGVSLDEEAADMIRFQHAYQASARVISMYDDILDIIVNLGR
jgi:flagellar hook-associated protein 1